MWLTPRREMYPKQVSIMTGKKKSLEIIIDIDTLVQCTLQINNSAYVMFVKETLKIPVKTNNESPLKLESKIQPRSEYLWSAKTTKYKVLVHESCAEEDTWTEKHNMPKQSVDTQLQFQLENEFSSNRHNMPNQSVDERLGFRWENECSSNSNNLNHCCQDLLIILIGGLLGSLTISFGLGYLMILFQD